MTKYESFIISQLKGVSIAQLNEIIRRVNLELAKRGLDNGMD